ncbi:glycine betaine/proline transport system permease protein [Paenibacillus catalpae]|uniref:Glycine betaine/proline transport system permease protein n=1 Tax=Paenibacillus catalpae TaxID=1045775 RepID=A0A1I1YRC4_9BACL|nr:proline/glycine betaine ABC transporter permease [Paenibacillus catalpae]SFE22145.1 glycine betaine/proline transport system permease protein [Paenibacillus catalpae]
MNIPKLPLGNWIESLESWLENHFSPLFDFIRLIIGSIVDFLHNVLLFSPSIIMVLIITALAWFLGKWKVAAFAFIGLLLIDNLGYWENAMETLAIVLTASLLSIIIGVPTGILCARSSFMQGIITPLLDFMQTMPAFVYLLPAVSFFSLGVVPGVIASIIFAVPPTIRLTNLGIRQVPSELVEAADAFGSTPNQKLFKLQLPMALPTMMAGINQTIMLSLSMVVISSMIGAQGLGADVYRAVTQTKTGTGFEAGISIVVLAILLDRMSNHIVKKNKR